MRTVLAAATLALALEPVAATGQTPLGVPVADQRCVFLGPAVVSGWMNLLRAYAEDDWTDAAEGTRLSQALATLYATIGCPVAALNDTLDCVTSFAFSGASEVDVHENAQTCMREAGMPLR